MRLDPFACLTEASSGLMELDPFADVVEVSSGLIELDPFAGMVEVSSGLIEFDPFVGLVGDMRHPSTSLVGVSASPLGFSAGMVKVSSALTERIRVFVEDSLHLKRSLGNSSNLNVPIGNG